MIATGLPDADPTLYAQAIDAMIRSGRLGDAARLAADARSRWATDAGILDRIVATAGAQERADAVETLTRGSALTGTRRLLRIAALHDLAVKTPPQSAAWQAFVTEANRFLSEQRTEGRDSVEHWLKDALR
jgi:hypothetical protein